MEKLLEASDSEQDKATEEYKASDSEQDKATEEYKIFNDSVHGHIKLHPLLVKIIDTPEFQRLKNIKQLGGGYYVFPGASHNRFEHSIGVAHLAGELLQNLINHQELTEEEKAEAEKDKLCVQIAGLCHDLGHGPFSHVFEVFMKEVQPEAKWEHEATSVKMFEKLITSEIRKKDRSYTIEGIMRDVYDFKDEDIVFIEELIYGPNPPTRRSNALPGPAIINEWPYKGREEKKSYLYEIVANKRTGIDVDKMDYFTRDCLHLGMKSNFSHERYVMFARVCTTDDNEQQICMRDKEALNMYELFHVRYLLHRNVYQHRVKVAIETMIVDALLEAESDFRINGRKISEAVSDLQLYLQLTDNILQDVKLSSEKAKEILKRIEKRDLYSFVDSKIFKTKEPKYLSIAKKKKEMLQVWLGKIRKTGLSTDDFRIKLIRFDYGMKEENPIDYLRFYRKNNPNRAVTLTEDEVSYILPETFSEVKVMLFCTKSIVLSKEEIGWFWSP